MRMKMENKYDPFLANQKEIQGTPEWLENRKNFIGASDAPIIMGESPWCTPLGLWEQKVGITPPPKENYAMRRGSAMESSAREAFNDKIGMLTLPQVVYHPKYDFMMASLDGLSVDETIAVEIKCPGVKAHALAIEGKVPIYYKAQLQHQMECSGPDRDWET